MTLRIPSEVERILEASAARAVRRMDGPEVPTGKPKRKHPKRHGENRERSREERATAAAGAGRAAANLERRETIAAAMRAYYRGEIDDLSSIAHLIGR